MQQRPPREREPVRVHARRGQPDQRIPGPALRPVDDRVQSNSPERRPDEVEAVRRGMAADHLRQLADLAARVLDPGRFGPDPQPDGDLAQQLGVGVLDREVVEQGERFGADADQVVDVHRHAVDPDRVETLRLLGDDHLGADAVSRERHTESRGDLDHARVMARQRHRERVASRIDGTQHIDERRHSAVGLARVNTGGCVGVSHVAIVVHPADHAGAGRRRRIATAPASAIR